MRTLNLWRWLALVSLLASAGVRGAAVDDVPLVMLGQCENLSLGGRANLRLTIVEQEGETWRGYLDLDGELVGSGVVSGTRTATKLAFDLDSPENDFVITFSGTKKEGRQFAGGYVFALRDPGQSRLKKEVGRWSAEVADETSTSRLLDEASQRAREFRFRESEADVARSFQEMLNQSQKDPKSGRMVTGAQSLFDLFHPIGTATKITVDDVQFLWRDDKRRYALRDLDGLAVRMTLSWKGPVTANGWTKLTAKLDPKTGEFSDLKIVGTNGITTDQATELSFDLGYLAGAVLFSK